MKQVDLKQVTCKWFSLILQCQLFNAWNTSISWFISTKHIINCISWNIYMIAIMVVIIIIRKVSTFNDFNSVKVTWFSRPKQQNFINEFLLHAGFVERNIDVRLDGEYLVRCVYINDIVLYNFTVEATHGSYDVEYLHTHTHTHKTGNKLGIATKSLEGYIN